MIKRFPTNLMTAVEKLDCAEVWRSEDDVDQDSVLGVVCILFGAGVY